MDRPLTSRETKYYKNAIEDYNGFDRNKAYRAAQDETNNFIKALHIIHDNGAYNWKQIAQELCISERSISRYLSAKYTHEIKVPMQTAVYAVYWASHLLNNPTKEAKRRKRRREYQERYQRQIYKVKGS